jgi:ATP-dependent DNA helicase PIF1
LIKIPTELLLDIGFNPIASMVSPVYPYISNHHLDPVYFQKRAIVTLKNATVSVTNDFILDMSPESKHVYLNNDDVCISSSNAEMLIYCARLNLSINLNLMAFLHINFP